MFQEKTHAAMPDALDQEYQAVALELAQKKAEEEALKPIQLLPKEALTKRFQKELQEEFTCYRKQQAAGVLALVGALNELATEMPDMFTEETVAGLHRIAGLSEQISKDRKKFNEQLTQGLTLQEIANVNDAVMDKLYQGAKRLYEHELFTEAVCAFQFLTSLNPKKYVFWQGLAHAEFHLKHYKDAIDAYSLLTAVNPHDPISHVAISRCYEELGDIPQALDAIDQALVALEEKTEYAHWKGEIQQAKAHLVQKKH